MKLQDLPDLALIEMLKFVDNEHKIKSLVLVCKRWYSFVQADLQELCIYVKTPPYKPYWDVLSQKQIDEQFIVRSKRLNEKFVIKFSNLKQLFLFKVAYFRVFLSSLNEGSLDRLQELTVMRFSDFFDSWPEAECLGPRLESKINLPSLKKLCSHDGPFLDELNAPNLESYAGPSYSDSDEFREKARFIMCRFFNTNLIFCNLEHLVCHEIGSFLQLEQMPRLKRVEVWPRIPSEFEIIEDLKKQKKRLNRRDLAIWVYAVKESFTPELVHCFWKRFYFDSMSFPSPLDPFDHFDYNEPLSVCPWSVVLSTPHLTQKFPKLEGIPDNFFNVFINIRELRISGVQVDAEHLIRFIQKAKNIEGLAVSGNQFDGCFFQEISLVQSLTRLVLRDTFLPNALDFGIGLIFNFQNIWYMRIETNLNFQISAQVFIEFLNTKLLTGRKATYDISTRNHFFNISTYHGYSFICAGVNDDLTRGFTSLDELIFYATKVALSKSDTMFV